MNFRTLSMPVRIFHSDINRGTSEQDVKIRASEKSLSLSRQRPDKKNNESLSSTKL